MLFAVRLTVSAAMLAYLLTRLDISSLLPRRQASTLSWVIGGLVITAASVVLSTLRWQRVLVALELPARLRTLLGHYLAGLFVGNFLPSTIGMPIIPDPRFARPRISWNGARAYSPFGEFIATGSTPGLGRAGPSNPSSLSGSG